MLLEVIRNQPKIRWLDLKQSKTNPGRRVGLPPNNQASTLNCFHSGRQNKLEVDFAPEGQRFVHFNEQSAERDVAKPIDPARNAVGQGKRNAYIGVRSAVSPLPHTRMIACNGLGGKP